MNANTEKQTTETQRRGESLANLSRMALSIRQTVELLSD